MNVDAIYIFIKMVKAREGHHPSIKGEKRYATSSNEMYRSVITEAETKERRTNNPIR